MEILLTILVVCLTYFFLSIYRREGWAGVLSAVITAVRRGVPGVEWILQSVLQAQVGQAVQGLSKGSVDGSSKKHVMKHLPKKGTTPDKLLEQMKEFRKMDTSVDDGKVFAFVYTSDRTQHFDLMREVFESYQYKLGGENETTQVLSDAYNAFSHENGLNPFAFPALRKFETETISMAASLFNGDEGVVGTMTSGGTESILSAMKAYRDQARKHKPYIKAPEVIAPVTVHPAFNKAASYFDLKMVLVPVNEQGLPDVEDFKRAITSNTILLVGSAPQYCHGVIDPIEELSTLALSKGLGLHVDACFGGFMLPWVEKLGYPIPAWDFRVPGVTSISADLHKYGWTVKGASVCLFRTAELRSHLIFAYGDWPGGLFASPTIVGTRPGGYIAASWAALMYLGEEGYLAAARPLMEATEKLKRGLDSIPELTYIGKPQITCLAICSASPEINVLVLAESMEDKGWKIELQQNPNSIHVSVMPTHVAVMDEFIADLKKSVEDTRGKQAAEGMAAMYGMTGKIPDRSIVTDFLGRLMSDVYTCQPE